MESSASTGDAIIPIGDSDATNFQFFETVDPILDAWFRYRGRVSKRRFLNIVRCRYRALWRSANLDPAWIKQWERRISDALVREYVLQALQPSYTISERRRDPFFDPPL